ncbi:hypothetical protein [Vibrio panuliri]|uniref:hypothetical protein n=1 Tax=Vibrio panuliri TaxID=1381081 RepID=UPI001386740B|nr:hypothetical protein [Vibrio panuliri]
MKCKQNLQSELLSVLFGVVCFTASSFSFASSNLVIESTILNDEDITKIIEDSTLGTSLSFELLDSNLKSILIDKYDILVPIISIENNDGFDVIKAEASQYESITDNFDDNIHNLVCEQLCSKNDIRKKDLLGVVNSIDSINSLSAHLELLPGSLPRHSDLIVDVKPKKNFFASRGG